MSKNTIVKFTSRADQEKSKSFKDIVSLYACLKSLEDITQEINLVIGKWGMVKNDLWLLRIAAEGYGKDELKGLCYLLELHSDNMKKIAAFLREIADEEDDTKISPLKMTCSLIDEEYTTKYTPIMARNLEAALDNLDKFEH